MAPLKQTDRFKVFFLLEFTKELIRHSEASAVYELRETIKEEEKETKRKVYQAIRTKEKKGIEFSNMVPSMMTFAPKRVSEVSAITKKPILIVPKIKPLMRVSKLPMNVIEPKLPPRLQYIQPIPTEKEIDLDRLNPLIKDPLIVYIECNGPDEEVIVRGTFGAKKTKIILKKEEIEDIIKKVSDATKIPLQEGIFKVAIGKLIFLAILSDVISPKFIIRKMIYSPATRAPAPQIFQTTPPTLPTFQVPELPEPPEPFGFFED